MGIVKVEIGSAPPSQNFVEKSCRYLLDLSNAFGEQNGRFRMRPTLGREMLSQRRSLAENRTMLLGQQELVTNQVRVDHASC